MRSTFSILSRLQPGKALHPVVFSLLLTLLLCLVYNGPLWRLILDQPYSNELNRWLFSAAFLSFMAAVIQLFIGLLAWPWLIKPVAVALLLSAAAINYFMESYGILIDKTMVQNLFETDVAEASDLINTDLLLHLFFKGVIPAALVLLIPLQRVSVKSQLVAQCLNLLVAGMLIGLNLSALNKEYASLFRNHREIRNLAVPSNYLYYTSRYLAGAYEPEQKTFTSLGTDAIKQPAPNGKPDLLVVVLGETARSQNFALNGYAADTNPTLSKRPVVSFSNVSACGTSTAVSVPCMFSLMTQSGYKEGKARYQSNVLDILQQAGIRVLWRDNNSGCKGVCDRVPNQTPRQFNADADCDGSECYDPQMLNGLQNWLKQSPQSTVIVLHQKGSHGPAYYKRVPGEFQHFAPTCTSNQLQDCSQQAITNAYDNTIRYTDYFLDRVIAFLQQQDAEYNTAMLYISDHGESLGENNLYLHGMPWLLAPEEQKKVPMITWLSTTYQQSHGLNTECLATQKDRALSHDYLTHSLLGLVKVSTQVYDPRLDLFDTCRSSAATSERLAHNPASASESAQGS
ncbi:phosphoethanolamine transferase [Marinobacterium stanieri]|uniref:Phosphatidylethanolamine:Kdo2-lipid A phosphoethanolamine transferase n=1 Tax=Marinobacterium stanieri TaxID=49186 RepID=A0A1N6SAZ7_9GAMM|nr:phosphoethanolamine--lipid A transferase [Marinobacterium stanieri]SIQ38239.1 phosphatidylethanolamine:Kdo2-lipid A phosphoethanolamine transferase [Marinobacterium stanieri]